MDEFVPLNAQVTLATPLPEEADSLEAPVEEVEVELTGEPEDLPPEFLRQKLEAKKTDIKKALKAGRTVPGAVLVEKQNLQIR